MEYNVYYYQPDPQDPMAPDWRIKKPIELINPKVGDIISAKRESGAIGNFEIRAVFDATIYASEVGERVSSIRPSNCERGKTK